MGTPFSVQLGDSFESSKSLGGGGIGLLLWMLAIVVGVVLLWLVWRLWREWSGSRREWAEFEELCNRSGLSREERALLRRSFRQSKISRPTQIIRSESKYASFFNKKMERSGHHTEILIKSIQRKLFGSDMK